MKGARVNHTLVERIVRSYAESNMRATVRISRPRPAVFDPVTGALVADAAGEVYSGPARIYTVSGPVTYAVGDEPQHYSSTYVSIPVRDADGVMFSEIPQVEDTVEVLTSPGDSEMVGRFFQVQDVESAGQWTAVRRLQVVGIQSSPQWSSEALP